MRRRASIVAIALAIPALVGFQVVSGPLLTCEFGECDLVLCEFDMDTGEWVCVKSGNEINPGCPCENESEPAGDSADDAGPCELVVLVVPDLSLSRDPQGCNGKEFWLADLCATGLLPEDCHLIENGPEDIGDPCSGRSTSRGTGPPGTVVALPSSLNVIRRTTLPPVPVQGATAALQASQQQQLEQHAHSPRLPIVAAGGFQICITKCSFLL